jgi:prophage regulatory protein
VTSKFRFVRLREVKEMTGLGETRILELEKAGKFPRRVKISDRAVAWVESELIDWRERLLASRTETV